MAELLAKERNAVWLRVDTIEASLVKAGIPRSFETGLAAYVAACDLARDHLRLPRDTIVDAVNGVEPARRMWRDLAHECGADRYVIELFCSDPEEHRRRVESRRSATPPLPPPTWHEALEREYAPWTEPILSIDGLHPAEENLGRIEAYLAGRGRRGGQAKKP